MSTLFVSLYLFAVGFSQSEAKSSCNIDATYRVDYSTNESKILLTLKEATYPIEIKLFNLEGSSYDFEKTRTIRNVKQEEFVAFDKLRNSTYLIQLVSSDCKITLGGLNGIKVENSL